MVGLGRNQVLETIRPAQARDKPEIISIINYCLSTQQVEYTFYDHFIFLYSYFLEYGVWVSDQKAILSPFAVAS